MSGIEEKLGVATGYPVTEGPSRESDTPDMDAVSDRWVAWGEALADDYGLTTEFRDLYNLYIVGGKHPQVAAETALSDLEIEDFKEDIFILE